MTPAPDPGPTAQSDGYGGEWFFTCGSCESRTVVRLQGRTDLACDECGGGSGVLEPPVAALFSHLPGGVIE